MKYVTLTLLLALFASISIIHLKAQCGPISLLTQADIDNFSTDYPGCTTVVGDLYVGIDINTFDPNDITNLDGLSQLTKVTGDLEVQYNDLLTDIDGLANIDSVGGDVSIFANGIPPVIIRIKQPGRCGSDPGNRILPIDHLD